MPSLAAALLVGLTAIAAVVPAALAAVVPGAEGPVPWRAAPTSATPFGANPAAARRLPVDGTTCDKVHDDGPQAPLSHEGLYGYIAEYGVYLFERFFDLLRASLLQTPDLTPAETAAMHCPVSIVSSS
jgi:hypothetical protein